MEIQELLIKAADTYVSVSDDGMEGILNLAPPEDGMDYTLEEILEILKYFGVKQGVNRSTIEEMIAKNTYFEDVVVAKGRECKDGENGKFEFLFKTELPILPTIMPDGSVDYKNMVTFVFVKRGQPIVKYHKATKGDFGFTVEGKLMYPKKGIDLPPIRGKGFLISQDRTTYYAALDGKVTWNNQKLEVTKLLLVSGNVDVSTGNVSFDGDVSIQGDVLAGFSVNSTGNVEVCGHIEGANISCKGDLVAKRGVQGAGIGVIHCEGDIYGNFFENVSIFAKGSLHANYLLNCNLSVMGVTEILGNKGVVIGGVTQSIQGIKGINFGNKAECDTILSVGITLELSEKYRKVIDHIKRVASELELFAKAKAKYENVCSFEQLRFNDTYQKIITAYQMKYDERKQYEKDKSELSKMMEEATDHRIVARGKVYPGVKVVVDMKELQVTQEIKFVKFEKKEDRVAVFKL